MDISGVSNSASYNDWRAVQTQKDKEEKNEEQIGAASGAQVTAVENTPDSLSQSEKVLNITNTDTVEISDEGRAFQKNAQAQGPDGPKPPMPQKPPVSDASNETGKSSTNLSTLTDQEIQDLLDKGTITQSEANAELARRSAEEQAAKTAQNSKNGSAQYLEEE